jgi:uncharacterized membrane protein YraQ (UPF0718 family)
MAASSGSRLLRIICFPAGVLVAYAVLLVAAPDRAAGALRASGRILLRVAFPLSLAFAVMFLLNFFIKPAHVSRLLGRGAGAKGLILSTIAGIVSMGPIYAWYPLLRDLREKGASKFHLANFLSNRAVKPFLLPVMVFYFGWGFVLVLNVLIIVGAWLTALAVAGLGGGTRAQGETR